MSTDSATVPRPKSKRNILIWFFGALGGILWGYDTGVISGAILFIKTDMHLTPLLEGMVVSGLLVGAMLGAGLSGRLSDGLGRRRLILGAAAVFILGTFGAAFCDSAPWMITFRFVIGIGVGIASVVVPLYLSELAPKHIRGGLSSLMQLLVTVGIFVAYLVELAFSSTGAWRWMIGLGAVPAILLLVGIIAQPESPRWLVVSKGRSDEARQVLTKLRGDQRLVDEELREIEELARKEREETEPLRLRMLITPRLRPIFIVGLLLVFFQNFVGINTIIYYAPTLLTSIGFDKSNAILVNVAIGAVNMLMTLPAMYLIDRKGRKPLLLVGAIGMCTAMVILAITNLTGFASGPLLLGISVAGIALYIASFSVSWGPVQWVALPELFPLRIRGGAVGLCVIFNWLFNFIVALIFPVFLQEFGAGVNFLFFAVMTLLAYLFVKKLLPETKGRSLEQIEQDLLHDTTGQPTASVN